MRAMAYVDDSRVHRGVEFHAYPRIVFAWPIILLGFLFHPLDAWGLVRPGILAWLWGGTLVVVVLALGTRIHRDSLVFWAILGSVVWLFVIYLRDARGLAQGSGLSTFVADLDP